MIVLLLLLALLAPPDPKVRAEWDGPISATITFTLESRGCLYDEHVTGERVFVSCYERPGSYAIELGHIGPLSGDLRPTAGDVYVLQTGGQTYRARLLWWRYLAAFRA